MAGNVVNLNRFRKKKQREEKAKQAEKDRERAERERLARAIEGKRLERDQEDAATPDTPSKEP